MEANTENGETQPSAGRIFLTAEWRSLVMLNYEVDPNILGKYVPQSTELDFFQGKTFMSLVGFQFLGAKLFGRLPLPFHSNFEEVNLRFYVRRRHEGKSRRGVVFIREIVPRRAVAQLARLIYGENYGRLPMRHRTSINAASKTIEYQWRLNGKWCRLHAEASGDPLLPQNESVEQFVTEHYWGYTSRRGGCIEYRVSHEPWRVWKGVSGSFDGDGEALYGVELGNVLRGQADSAFIADGSSVVVLFGRRI